MHWAVAYVMAGIRWASGADTEAESNCWHFCRRVQREQFGRELPADDFEFLPRGALLRVLRRSSESRRWRKVGVPQDGDLVLMAKREAQTHIGVWADVDGGRVVHCIEGAGVVAQSLTSVRLAGWGRIWFRRRIA